MCRTKERRQQNECLPITNRLSDTIDIILCREKNVKKNNEIFYRLKFFRHNAHNPMANIWLLLP